MSKFIVGSEIEFWSEDKGGCWKKGIVASSHNKKEGAISGKGHILVRIKVGDKCYIRRSMEKCRIPIRENSITEKSK